MQHVDQHMDDLFRNAAENYQLKALQDWDKVAPYLSEQTYSASVVAKPANKKLWLIIPLLLMMSVLLLITLKKETPGPVIQSAKTNIPTIENAERLQSSTADIPTRNSSESIQLSTSDIHQESTKVQDQMTGYDDQISKAKIPELNSRVESSTQNLIPGSTGKQFNAFKTSTATSPEIAETSLLTELPTAGGSANHPTVQTINKAPNRDLQVQPKIHQSVGPSADPDIKSTVSIPVKKTPEIRGFYLGLNAGPQWNQVQNQGYNKTGFNLGIIAGFSFNKRLAVESGISYSKKYYYSDGQYFHMKKNPGTPAMKVISLDGSSNVIEIPAKIRYDIIDRKKGELFVTSGLSTYILTKENNQYYALINGTPQNSNVVYKDNKTYLVGGLNLSTGYSIHLKKQTDIRIEPYLQIPFKGTGVGSMRVTTTGLNIGITRTLHR